jgi:hypothetical protein
VDEQGFERGRAGDWLARFNVIGLLRYIQSQDLATGYEVCLPNLNKVTRSTYFDHERVILSKAKLVDLTKDLQVARKLRGRWGSATCDIRSASRAVIDSRP